MNEGDFVMRYGIFDMPDEIANAQEVKPSALRCVNDLLTFRRQSGCNTCFSLTTDELALSERMTKGRF
ncbi:hypothetical protein AOG23_06580 [Rhizobium acidisoli]|nr:hypothetical protein AOG23_06580 [Rhizobium acidisoli]